MKSYQMSTAIDGARKALDTIAYLDAEQLLFIKRIINDGICELVMQRLEDERAKEAEEEEAKKGKTEVSNNDF